MIFSAFLQETTIILNIFFAFQEKRLA